MTVHPNEPSIEEVEAEWGYPDGRKWHLTGRSLWLEAAARSGGSFPDETAPEKVFHLEAPFGTQSGTYWKTARAHNHMTVWTWGGLSDLDRATIAIRLTCTHGAPDWLPCGTCLAEIQEPRPSVFDPDPASPNA